MSTDRVRETIAAVEAYANEERRLHMEGYSASGERFLGVPVPDIRRVAHGIARDLRDSAPRDVIALAVAHTESGYQEVRQVGYEILEKHKPALHALKTTDVRALGKGMDNWASVDSFSCSVAGRVWHRGQISDAEIHRWARSKDRWWRRASLASTIPLNLKSRGGSGDPERTLTVCTMAVGDDDDMVVKALSWALRHCIAHDKSGVAAFLRKHQERLASRVLREVGNKLSKGLKN